MTLADALKAFRRGAHLYGPDWYAVCVVPDTAVMSVAWDETCAAMNASSHAKGLDFRHSNRTIRTANGATLRFAFAEGVPFLQGLPITQVIFCNADGMTSPETTSDYLRACMRRDDAVQPADLRFDEVERV